MIENDKELNTVDFNATDTFLIFFKFRIMQVCRTSIKSYIDTVKSNLFIVFFQKILDIYAYYIKILKPHI